MSNIENRLYCGDCKDVINDMIKEGVKVDLIYLDPPFNSSRVYNMVFNNGGSRAQQKAFNDTWSFTRRTRELFNEFEAMLDSQKDIDNISKAFLKAWLGILKEGNEQDKTLLNYLMYMTERLILMRKLLADNGSIYYHCDPTASHYIKVVMDGIFKRENFLNEIAWCYESSGKSKRWFSKKHDIILFYRKNKNYNFFIDKVKIPRKKGKHMRMSIDENGREYEEKTDRKTGKVYRWYFDEGRLPFDYWIDINTLNRQEKERLGYPTQKPVALLDRIVKASCPEGGVIFDPFCGCGTTIEAAHLNNAQWIGCDISYYAIEEIKNRLSQNAIASSAYQLIQNHPASWDGYQALNPYEKQDWLIRQVKGFPNPNKSRDRGIDGEIKLYLGKGKENKDTWGKMIISVKTGKQANPAMIRELKGTMKENNAAMGGLILDRDPTPNMEESAIQAGKLEYSFNDEKDVPPNEYDRIQILTAV